MRRVHCRQTLGRHCLLLDEALDCYLSQKIKVGRGVSFFGASFASDESPPAGARFVGYRFQVTFLYIPWFLDESRWEASPVPPIKVEKVLLDVCHCSGKDGKSVLAVITKQLERLNLSLTDIVGGVGDGGGENEGVGGVHAKLEHLQPSYVRRRCMGHLSWRCADACLDSMGSVHKDVQAVCTYLRDGITWKRLQAIATQPVASGGLGLFRHGSADFMRIFSTAPNGILDGRPETVSHFLLWLSSKEAVLSECIDVDVRTRDLAAGAHVASNTLKDPFAKLCRAISAGVLERCLFLFRWVKAHPRISEGTTLSDLMARCLKIMTSLIVDEAFFKRFGIDPAHVVARGLVGVTWVEVVMEYALDDPAYAQLKIDRKADLFEFHRKIATRAATHLQMNLDNMARFSWLLGGMVSTDAVKARQSAREARHYLLNMTPANTNELATYLNSDNTLLCELGLFCESEPAQLLWRGRAKYKTLFVFVASRFLASPDHVLDCEGMHARWKWVEEGRRNLKLKALNAILRLSSYINQHGDLPPLSDLVPHLQCIRQHLREQYDIVRAGGEVALGARGEAIYRERFNLGAADMDLMKAPRDRQSGSSSPQVWSHHLTSNVGGTSAPKSLLSPSFTITSIYEDPDATLSSVNRKEFERGPLPQR
jgi:hypothetical protein